MTVFLPGGERRGAVRAPASKSAAQRLFYCAALGAEPCEIACGPLSEDLEAMLACLAALGASVDVSDGRVRIEPIRLVPARELVLPCGESGAALRLGRSARRPFSSAAAAFPSVRSSLLPRSFAATA